MALLKKKVFRRFTASSLVENLVASVLIVIVFMIASLSINNVFGNYIQGDEHEIQRRFSELSYLFIHDKISYGFSENYEENVISIERTNGVPFLFLKRNGKLLKTKQIIYNEY
ncbi:hypothetical protein [Zunongwangia pacifica]|uniref:Uncharacterized protein n=1 Tax=Zunongwangia pacifica TaxID=2911062 RepID=A0A9X1ZUY9_9FLAO|nr:hypothetical protein [Zunongwangia pacifica]MCL6220596.1 hypothetical protein [Zunongwangia pacifica]